MAKLMKIELPSDEFKAWFVVNGFTFGKNKSVCEAIIICCAWLDGILYKKITEHSTYNKSIKKKIKTFCKRIKFAYDKRIISIQLYNHIDLIRTIRNGYGHLEWQKSKAGSGMTLMMLKKEEVEKSIEILLNEYAEFLKDFQEYRKIYYQEKNIGAIIMIIIAILFDLINDENRLEKYIKSKSVK